MRVFLNPGHAPNGEPDAGACNRITGLRECDVAKNITDLVEKYLVDAGVEVVGNLQSDSLCKIVQSSNNLGAYVFISIHCNAFNEMANGTEVWHYHTSRDDKRLAGQIVDSLGMTARGAKGAVPHTDTSLYVLNYTDAVAVLVETAFIDNPTDEEMLRTRQDDFARAIARGVTDYELEVG